MATPSPIAVITGGSRGIGCGIAKLLSSNGWSVAVLSRNGNLCKEIAASLDTSSGKNCHVGIACDVANPAQVEQAIHQVHQELGDISALVNAAGITKDGLFVRAKEEDIESQLSINLKGSMYTCKAVSKRMMLKRQGCIVNIGSIVGSDGNVGQTVYSTSKSGLIGLTKSLARELGPKGIRVNLVEPGYIETEMTQDLTEQARKDILARTSLRRLGHVADVANLVDFLLGNRSSFITGQVIRVDGNLSL